MPLSDTELSEILFASANASVHFSLSCLTSVDAGDRLRATSTFVDAQGTVMHWHDFGDLEGPGWAANAVGGALLLLRWGRYIHEDGVCGQALRLVDHVLQDGFVRDDGFIWPYRDLAKGRFCLNYAHTDDWLCPGSLAKVGCQMLELADELGHTVRAVKLRSVARGLGDWLYEHVGLLPNGWVPRRVAPDGVPYTRTPEGGDDPIFDHSADGLYLLDLWMRQGRTETATALGDAFVTAGGFWGSLNHDTYDDYENVAYAVAFRILRRAADVLSRPKWRDFAYEVTLPAMANFRMSRDEHGVITRGLYWMERTWDTAYLWENAEVAQAHLEAWLERDDVDARDAALATLCAIAHHHDGPMGFLTEGIDWNNHVSQRHHVGFDYYGAIRYTEPLLNNLHLIGPTLTYLTSQSVAPCDVALAESLTTLAQLSPVSETVRDLQEEDGRLLLRLYHPAIATEVGVEAALAFCREAEIDGVLLFEASFDTDPALLSLDVLEQRFVRLREIVPRFREAGLGVHINVMITMGHSDQGGGQPEDFDFQFLVDANGEVSRSTACPLDPAFLAYVTQMYRWAAACGADAVWVDDDVRFLWHDLSEMTCFCPYHIAAMADRTGRAWTREQLVVALADDDSDPAIRQAWFDLQAEAMTSLAACVERAVHTVDPDQSIGLMSVGTAVHNVEGRRTDRLLRALSGENTRPMLRPGSGFWNDWEPAGVLAKTEEVARQTAYLGADVRVVAEIENHPYSPLQKSLRLLALEMALDTLAGTHDLSLNIFSGTMPFRPAEVDYAGFLRAQRPFLQALRHARAGKRRIGVGVEAREDVPERLPLSGGSLMRWIEPRPWELVLARLGLPVGTFYDAPHLLSGSVVYTDRYALGSSLQDGALLTPGAVRGLLSLGWGEVLGIEAVSAAPRDANEVLTEDVANGSHTGVCLPVRHYADVLQPHTWTFAAGVTPRVLSKWQDLRGLNQSPATVALELPDGRRVGLLPFDIRDVSPALLQSARRDQWAALLSWVMRRPLPARIVRGINVMPQVFVSRNGDVLLALVNLSYDDVVAELDAPILGKTTSVERLSSGGQWLSVDDPIHVPVDAWSVTVLRATV